MKDVIFLFHNIQTEIINGENIYRCATRFHAVASTVIIYINDLTAVHDLFNMLYSDYTVISQR